MTAIHSCLEKHNANLANLVELHGESSADQLQYATIRFAKEKSRSNGNSGNNPIDLVDAVYEWQFSPLIYLVDGNDSPCHKQLARLRSMLALRGDAPYLGVASDRKLELFHIAYDNRNLHESMVNPSMSEKEGLSLFSQISRYPDANNVQSNWIESVVYKLMLGSISSLNESYGVELNDAISLVGRVLFTRFLADRGLLPPDMNGGSGSSSLFDDPEVALSTSTWLDKTFNGDFLPLSKGVFSKLPQGAFNTLGSVLRKAPDDQLFLGWEQKWDYLDFAHVPVGVLSKVYESLLRGLFPELQRRQSAYYTPNQIVNLMVKTSMQGVKNDTSVKNIRVLDPAAGAGVFLITAFRELVAERWRLDGKRPDTKTLRKILNNQITGFEIDESALRFAALGLYLMSIELDPNPELIGNVKFENLRESVLFNLNAKDAKNRSSLGSINPKFGKDHRNKYDIVIGNPPWKSNIETTQINPILSNINQLARERGSREPIMRFPHRSIDLAFLWRSMEWAKKNGQIALILHARWLFQQGGGMAEFRNATFKALKINSIVNCTSLRDTKFWPNMNAPFCLIFGENSCSGPGSQIRYVSPSISKLLNNSGKMQLDIEGSNLVTVDSIREFPEILKILSIGSREDSTIFARMKLQSSLTLKSFWTETNAELGEHREMHGSGVGYTQIGSKTLPKKDNELKSHSKKRKHELEITKNNFVKYLIQKSELINFSNEFVKSSGKQEVFLGPMLVVDRTPSRISMRINCSVCDYDAKFNRQICGYSMSGRKEGKLLARFLCLIMRSKIAMWQILLTSGAYGVERNVFEKFELDSILIPDFRMLTKNQKSKVEKLFNGLDSGDTSLDKLDQWAAGLYDLDALDMKLISDTLEFNTPIPTVVAKAEESPTPSEIRNFCVQLEKQINPMLVKSGKKARIETLDNCTNLPWICLNIDFGARPRTQPFNEGEFQVFRQTANSTLSYEFIKSYGKKRLLVGRIGQKRYWNFTSVKILAKKIVWSGLEIFNGDK